MNDEISGDGPSDAELPGLDLERLRSYLDRELPGLVSGPLGGRVIAGGKSNLTYAVTDGTGSWVVRRPPLGHVLATAHDMPREYRVMTALRDTSVPVPRTHVLCEETEVLGAPFYVMEHVAGTPLRTLDEIAPLGTQGARKVADGLITTLGNLHAVEPAEVGLGDFGRPAGFLERQVRRWSKQLEASRSRDIPGIDELRDELAARLPEQGAPAIVHGDYRLDNVLVTDDGRLTAVLDWEMATLGAPLVDLGLMLVYREQPVIGGSRPATSAEGFPSSPELVQMYAAATGRDVSRLGWYVAFGCFKLAVIAEGIHFRHSRGLTVGAGFDGIGDVVAPLVQRAHTMLKED
ncbi:phosphotransferase family protein [Nocardiopsis metallicus]|uniref:Aminoglycoside phosphotransferase (APT) family kinase protein n=1 Tax=Nocardiopsis metallicus TaxID=179819 RepID=A0A840WHQ8_9ACTN|nr:phosphotransferase family protein [Nocardiopsis metallicus]MBB5491217.1 aminoglycoside phosphotransferase (APT) family kinase protein [Nocardiopsis metallicus]